MRLLHPGFALATILVLQAGIQSAHAQPNDVAPPPPQLEPLEEGEAPSVTINAPQTPQTGVAQKRAPGGKIIETTVTTGNKTYYLRPNDQMGSAASGDMQGSSTRAAQWEVLNFDFRSEKEKQNAADAASRTPAPPPMPAK